MFNVGTVPSIISFASCSINYRYIKLFVLQLNMCFFIYSLKYKQDYFPFFAYIVSFAILPFSLEMY